MIRRLLELIYPPRCILCRKILPRQQSDLCQSCEKDAPVFRKEKIHFSFVARWTAVWYYKDDVRQSLLRYKFGRYSPYAFHYAHHLAQKLRQEGMDQAELLVWVPISFRRKLTRRFDQTELLARALSKELNIPAERVIKKVRHTPPQSGLKSADQRRANVLGAYRITDPERIRGRHVLLLDDIITTGATVSECAKLLSLSGCGRIDCAAVAIAPHERKNK